MTSRPRTAATSAAASADVKVEAVRGRKKKMTKEEVDDLMKWLTSVYQPDLLPDERLEEIYEELKYDGFNKLEVLGELRKLTHSPEEVIEIVIACSLRGPVQAAKLTLSNGKTISQMGIRGSGLKGQKGISCSRIAAATADLAAYYLKRLQVPKRLNMECPAWLQFPSAGSIKMPDNLRQQHIEFSKKFSEVIGGEFNEQIYSQMVANAYLDPKLKLFD